MLQSGSLKVMNIFIKNLPLTTTRQNVMDMFNNNALRCTIRASQSYVEACVGFDSFSMAYNAIQQYDGYKYQNNVLTVAFDNAILRKLPKCEITDLPRDEPVDTWFDLFSQHGVIVGMREFKQGIGLYYTRNEQVEQLQKTWDRKQLPPAYKWNKRLRVRILVGDSQFMRQHVEIEHSNPQSMPVLTHVESQKRTDDRSSSQNSLTKRPKFQSSQASEQVQNWYMNSKHIKFSVDPRSQPVLSESKCTQTDSQITSPSLPLCKLVFDSQQGLMFYPYTLSLPQMGNVDRTKLRDDLKLKVNALKLRLC
ncbi:hypothetical protein MP228_001133 [Amoeboaphelidium protococcarum]|nr:hypothetical protein MP228_001133 [Amoeboaphelidium protococcarum]